MGLFIKYAFTPKHRQGPKHRYNVVALDGQDWQSAHPTDSPKHRAPKHAGEPETDEWTYPLGHCVGVRCEGRRTVQQHRNGYQIQHVLDRPWAASARQAFKQMFTHSTDEPWVDPCCAGFDSNEHSPDCPTL